MTPFWRFAHRLALALGEPNPEALMNAMPGHVLDGWIEFNRVEPIGEPHADYRMATLAMLMGNAWLRDKNQRAYRVADFIPRFGVEDGRLDVERLANKIRAINAAFGGRVIDKRKGA